MRWRRWCPRLPASCQRTPFPRAKQPTLVWCQTRDANKMHKCRRQFRSKVNRKFTNRHSLTHSHPHTSITRRLLSEVSCHAFVTARHLPYTHTRASESTRVCVCVDIMCNRIMRVFVMPARLSAGYLLCQRPVESAHNPHNTHTYDPT